MHFNDYRGGRGYGWMWPWEPGSPPAPANTNTDDADARLPASRDISVDDQTGGSSSGGGGGVSASDVGTWLDRLIHGVEAVDHTLHPGTGPAGGKTYPSSVAGGSIGTPIVLGAGVVGLGLLYFLTRK